MILCVILLGHLCVVLSELPNTRKPRVIQLVKNLSGRISALGAILPMLWGSIIKMLRLTLMLSAVVYAVLVIYSENSIGPAVEDVEVARDAAVSAPELLAANVEPTELLTDDGRVLQIAARFDPTGEGYGFNQVAAVSTASEEGIVMSSASLASMHITLMEVTGRSVNLRAGPSTNDRILGSLVRGEQAELVASLDNGWAQIRSVSTGTEGFMADRFLAPVN